MSLAVLTDSTTAQASPALTVRPMAGSSTNTISVSSACAWSVMPTVAVSPLTRTHSCDFANFRSEGMLLINYAVISPQRREDAKKKLTRITQIHLNKILISDNWRNSRQTVPGFSSKYFLIHHAFGNLGHAASHLNRKIVADLDLDFSAGHVDGDGTVAQAELVRHGRRRAAAAAACQRVTRAAFPNLNLDIRAVEDFQEL